MKRVLVTGAASGIGRATVLRLDHLGYEVLAGVRREGDAAGLLATASPSLHTLLLDVTDQQAVSAAAVAAGPALDGLVNCAGVVVPGPVEGIPVERWQRQLEVNVVAVAALTRALLPAIRAARGRIVNVSSLGGRLAVPFLGAYAASKFALEAYSDALRAELRPWGIQVVVVEPDAVATPIWGKIAAGLGELAPDAQGLYGPVLERYREVVARAARAGVPPERVADAIARALTAPRPRTRVVVARRGQALAVGIARRLPDRWRDRMLTARLPSYP
jgi:NAD(P)-dependent dehydrogenase (short-subunit alcohol dehydrogenase family)